MYYALDFLSNWLTVSEVDTLKILIQNYVKINAMLFRYYFLLLGILFTQCTNENSNPLETPFFSLLESSGIKIDTVTQAANTWEYGFKFTSLVNGKLSKLGILVPDTGSYKVRLYNLSSNILLLEQNIASKKVNTESFVNVSPIEITAGTNFGVSLVADVFFNVRNANGDVFNFPITKGNIKIISFNEDPCGANGCPSFPLTSVTNLIAPCVNIGFTAD